MDAREAEEAFKIEAIIDKALAAPGSKRARHKNVEEEDAAQLKLGAEFSNVSTAYCASLSYVKWFVENHLREAPSNPVFQKALEHVNTFSKFQDTQVGSVTEEQDRLEAAGIMTRFESVALVNLCPFDADEAKSLVPSLSSRSDEDVQNFLDFLRTAAMFQD